MQYGTIYNILFANDRVDFSFNEKCTEATKKLSEKPENQYWLVPKVRIETEVNLPKERNPQIIAGRHYGATNIIVQQYKAHQNIIQMASMKW